MEVKEQGIVVVILIVLPLKTLCGVGPHGEYIRRGRHSYPACKKVLLWSNLVIEVNFTHCEVSFKSYLYAFNLYIILNQPSPPKSKKKAKNTEMCWLHPEMDGLKLLGE